MPASKAFRAACLAAGVATAWSPLATESALADSVVQINLTFGSSSLSTFTRFEDVYVGFTFTNSSPEIFGQNVFPLNSAHDPADFDKFVMVGLTGESADDPLGHVVVSFANPIYDQNFEDIFTDPVIVYGTEAEVASQLHAGNLSFISKLLNDLDPPAGVLQTFAEGSASLVVFTFGDGIGRVDLSVSPSPVPLPGGVYMGGTLLAMLASGKRARAWLFGRQPA